MADYRGFLIKDACAKLSWRIEHSDVHGDRIQLGLHGLFAKVANIVLAGQSCFFWQSMRSISSP